MERCIERCWGVARNGTGTLTGCRRVHLPVAWALSRDQVMASPTSITPSSPFSYLSFPLLFSSFDINLLFPTNDFHTHFGATSAILFTGTEPRYA